MPFIKKTHMNSSKWVRTVIGLIILSMNIGCDQFTKAVVRNEIQPSERISVITDHLTLTNIENSGAFLSMGQGWWPPAKALVLIVLPIIALLFGLYYMIRVGNREPLLLFALAFAIGGGIGNMTDRVLYGSVTDFMHVKIGPLQTGIFNMADVSIMIGIGILLVLSFKRRLNVRRCPDKPVVP